MTDISRRHLLQVAAAGALSSVLGSSASGAEATQEGQRELYSLSPIEVYTNTLSAEAGEEVTIHVSTLAGHFNLQIARIGADEKMVWSQDGLHGAFHPTPDDAWQKGCRWPASVRLKIPADWTGYYQIKAITADDGEPSREFYAFVVVRAKQPTAKTLLVLATNTYGAYNNYGGASLYLRKDGDLNRRLTRTSGEHKISFQRPLMPGFLWKPEGCTIDRIIKEILAPREQLIKNYDVTHNRGINKHNGIDWMSVAGGFHNWERVMVRWLENNGYAVDYAISSDLELHPHLLSRYRLMLTAGHDEYWSWGMRDTVESFVAKGGNVCFFSGDVAFWQVRFEDQGHSMVGYKDNYRDDPYFKSGQKQFATGCWSSHYTGRPETRLTGLSTWYGGYSGWGNYFPDTPKSGRGYVIYRPEHWVFKDTGLAYGDSLGQTSGIVAYELDGCPIEMENGLPRPASYYDGPSSLEILGMIPARWGDSDKSPGMAEEVFGDTNPKVAEYFNADHQHAVMGIFTNNGTVFSAGTVHWADGLTGKDPAVERVTKNLIDRLSV